MSAPPIDVSFRGARVLVTGATGLLGSAACALATERGATVAGLVRPGSDDAVLRALGVECVPGDITDAASVGRAARGADAIVHAAALVGGTWASSDAAAFEAANLAGTVSVLDAAEREDVGRTVVIGTIACLQTPDVPVSETSPVPDAIPGESPYARTKRAAVTLAHRRHAERDLDVVEVVPGAIYGPAPATRRALVPTSFNRTIVTAVRGELPRYARVELPWSTARDVADVVLRSLRAGVPGRRYLATGPTADAQSVPSFLDAACRIAGVPHRVEEVPPSDDPAFDAEFGSMAAIARRRLPHPIVDNRLTCDELGYAPTSVADGLAATIGWLRRIGEL